MSETADSAASAAEKQKDEKYLIFSILGKQYSFPSRLIGEIALLDAVYPLPLMPSYVLGVINRYSIPYALFDIGLLLFKNPSPRSKVLVLKDNVDRIAFLIDDVIGIADVPEEKLLEVERGTSSQAGSAESGEVSEAVSASFEWNDGFVFVLDLQHILVHAGSEAAW